VSYDDVICDCEGRESSVAETRRAPVEPVSITVDAAAAAATEVH